MATRKKTVPSSVDWDGASPHSDKAETAVIAALLKDNSAWDLVSISLSERDFFRPWNRLIYRFMGELIDAQMPAGVISLHEWLKKAGKAKEAGGLAYLKALAGEISDPDNIRHCVEVVRENARRRELVSAGYGIAASARNPGEKSVEKLLAEAEQVIFRIVERDSRGEPGFEPMSSLVAEVFAQARMKADRPGEITGISTGFYDLDRIISGLRVGELMVVAAPPNTGKTALALNIAEHVALVEGLPVAMFSMGNDALEITLRLLGSVARVAQGHLRSGQLGEKDWQRVSEAAERLRAVPLHIDGVPYRAARRVRASARRLSRQCGKLGLIIVEDMHLLFGSHHDMDTRRTGSGAIAQHLKLLALELQCPVISLLQLRSVVESHERWRPTLADLPDSAAIQQEADAILFICREDCCERDSREPGVAEIVIARQRRGPTGLVRLAFSKQLVRFESLAWAGDEE